MHAIYISCASSDEWHALRSNPLRHEQHIPSSPPESPLFRFEYGVSLRHQHCDMAVRPRLRHLPPQLAMLLIYRHRLDYRHFLPFFAPATASSLSRHPHFASYRS